MKQEPSEVPRERHGRNPRAFRPGRTAIRDGLGGDGSGSGPDGELLAAADFGLAA